MSVNDNVQIDALLVEVLKKPKDEREEYLDLLCRDDDHLRRELQGLLAASDEAADFLERPAVRGDETALTPISESPGMMIGRYKLLQRIGEGGFGVVYMAEQTEPVRRKVALKIIKLGMDTKQVIARFEAERQALAMMEHPNIAHVFDAGATDTGRPYFVMELVKGIAITDYCDRNNLTVQARLDLFMQVCSAVQHAHQKGIIHRDIKPSNVLVTLHDGVPVPKVIDFGIAKATSAELTEKTLFTEHGQMIGTPAYMSPEQAEMSGLDIDTRSDIYSLGVLLYELLTGTTPFSTQELRGAGFAEMQRIIREQEPHKPSTRVSSLASVPRMSASGASPSEPPTSVGADLRLGSGADDRGAGRAEARGSSIQKIAKQRRTDPSSLSHRLRGDLDWIIMKALEKDRTRRYETANGFAADVQRHLDDEPVVAGPPGAAYRLSKFVRRNRTGVITAAAVLLLLLAGIAGTSMGLIRARAAKQAESQQRQIAEQKTTEAQDNLKLARKQEQKANASRDEAQKQKQHAENAAHEARRQSYLANIFAADTAIQSNEIVTARNRLEATPSEFRNWEWNYLHAALDESITPVLVDDGVDRHIIAISADATRAVTQIVDGVHTIWNLDTGKPIAHFQREAELLEGSRPLRFNADGTRIVAALKDRTVRIWDAATGEHAVIPAMVVSTYLWASLSPDRTRIVTSTNGMVRIWDAATGEQLTVFPTPYYWVSASFSPDGTRIVTANWDGVARLWDAATGEKLATLDGSVHGKESWFFDFHVQCASFSPDGKRIVTVSTNRTACIWDASTGEALAVFLHDGHVRSASFSPDGTRIVTACGDKTARIWDAATGDQLFVLRGHDEEVTTAAFSPDATRIVTASSDRTVRTWDAGNGEQLAVYLGHEHPVYSAVFTPDGTRIVSASDHAAHIWDATADDHLRVRGADIIPDGFGYAGIWSVSFSPDGRRIMTTPAYSKEQDRIWDAVTGEQLAALHRRAGKMGGPPSFSPDGTRIVDTFYQLYPGSSDRFGSVRIWDAITGEQVRMLSEHESVGRVSFTPDGTRIVTSAGGTALLFDAATGEELPLPRGYNNVGPASFSPDGTKIFTFSLDDMSFHIRDAATGEQLAVLDGHHDSMRSPSFSPDATRIVTTAEDNTARIWDAATGEQLFALLGHDDKVHSASFSPDGTRIVTASQDNTARIWDAATGEQLLVLRGHEVAVKLALFSPDGTRIVTGHDTTIRIWDRIPYAQRYREKRVLKDAESEAVRVLDTVTATAPQRDGAPDLRAVAESIRTDSAIDEAVRHVALNLLMHRAGQIQSKANDLIDELKAQFVFAADIREAVQADESLEPAARAAAINIARWIEDSPGRLYYWASQVVKDDDRSPAEYEQAQRAAASAFQDDSTSEHFARTLAKAWTRLQQPDKAIEVWREHVDQMRAANPTGDWNLTNALFEYGEALLENDRAKDAAPLLRECLSIIEKRLNKEDPHASRRGSLDHWQTKSTRRVLGECLTKLAKFTEAEAILIELANATLDDVTATKDRKTEAIQRMVDLYKAWHAAESGKGYDAKAAEWRAKLSTAPPDDR